MISDPATEASGAVTPTARTRYTPRHAFDLAATMAPHRRGTGDPTCRTDAAGIWRTQRTPHGPATLLLSRGTDGVVDARAWGPGSDWSIGQVPALLGADDDWSGLDLSGHPAINEVRRRAPGVWLGSSGLVFESLVPAIIEQKVTTVEAHRAWNRLIRQHGDPAPGPAPAGMMVSPGPERWRLIPSWDWHRAGVDPRRSRTAVTAAAVAPALDRPVDAVTAGRRLQSLAGIGRWTAAEVTQRSHGDADAVSVGDYHLAAQVGWALTGAPVDDDGMLELLEPFIGHRQRVVRLILGSGYRAPRHGPRMTIQDHRGH
ncbi:DNA-3-methyladenine glycosylase 2 family protein [Cryobacterium sp. 1639]|uniref:DNA-3-methyladenine glycosylase family protein n=1 Tax=Cryobacterium inferilacus TaxID=2866629 RepID=UPI001C731937|nr:DNA-3-methyladenine glycosylase 2 family protein [Cryobacterium sp. 1639]MBX0300668.1 DNA-3-methyladenine glycosylase 2 family protein [Cryobacterium sp. 1639]